MRFSSKNLAAFYYQLGTLIQAGLPIQSALVSTRNSAPRPMRRAVTELSAVVDRGTPLSEAMEKLSGTFAPLDVHTIGMTERSGTLDIGLLSLSRYYENRAAARNKLIAGSVYPVALLIAVVFIIHVPPLFLGTLGGKPYTLFDFLRDTVGVLVGLALVGWVVTRLTRWLFAVPGLNVTLDRLLLAVPVFGRLRFDYALSQWVSSVRLTLAAGVGIVEALESASRTIPSPLIADAYRRAAPLIGGQLEVSQALASTGVFPDHVIQFWSTGEKSGRMDEMLDRLAQFYEDRWRRSLDQVVTWLPRIAYGLVAAFIVFQIFKTFNTYLSAYDTIWGK
jgi:type IV pilus assembly protein PilC